MWTLVPVDTTPGRIQAILGELPSLEGEIQPGVGDYGRVSGSGSRPPKWMWELADALEARHINYTIE